MFEVIVHKRAAQYLRKLPKPQKESIKKVLTELRTKPLQKFNIKQMLGEWKGYYRIRIGNIRVIFWIDQEENTIYIDHIGPRGNVYK